MARKRYLFVVDSHTMGEPTRVLVGGIRPIPGRTMAEKRQVLQERYDHLRRALMHEPRGHRDMFGSILMEPSDPSADLGIVFMDGGGYLNMCVHGTIGAVTVALETGLLDAEAPQTRVTLDTPAGLVSAIAEVDEQAVRRVTVENVPSFLYREGLRFDVPGIGRVEADIAFGGSFFALVDVSDLGIRITPENARQLVDAGMRILHRVNQAVEVSHPTMQHIRSVDLVELHEPRDGPTGKRRNLVVFGQGQFDRSPCGTGTCARMAALFSKGELTLGEEFIHEGIIGTTFTGRILRQTAVGDFPAVVPEIAGQAFLTGMQHLIIDPDDPLKDGFQI